jgi:hypothetical protein
MKQLNRFVIIGICALTIWGLVSTSLFTTVQSNDSVSLPLSSASLEFEDRCGAFLNELDRSYAPIQQDFVLNGKGKALVYVCEGSCAGMGDRIRGIVTTFLQAVLTNRAFLIDHTFPVQLSEFFEFANPSLSWEYNASMTEGMNKSEEWLRNDLKIGYRYRTENFHETLSAQVHKIHTNLPIQMYLTWNPHLEKEIRKYRLDKINYIDLPGCIQQYLLKPKGDLQKAMGEMKEKYLDKNYVIGIQIRTGGEGKWVDEPGRVPRSALDYFWKCAETIENSTTGDLPVKWFLTTDSDYVRKYSLSTFGNKVFEVAGNVVHVDKLKEGEDAKQGVLKTLVDMLTLAEADKLIISRSNFAEVAALRNFHGAFVYPLPCKIGEERTDHTRWWHVDHVY